MKHTSGHRSEFLRRVEDDGLKVAVAWAQQEVRPLDWDSLKRNVMEVRAPQGPKDVRVLCELSDHVSKFDSLFRDGLYVASRGHPFGMAWARQMYRSQRYVAATTAGEGPWLVSVFWEQRDRIAQNPAWTWVWKAMWKRWEGTSVKPHYMERANQVRDLLGVAMVHHLGGKHLRCSLHTRVWIEDQLEKDLSMGGVWRDGANTQHCVDALDLLGLEVRRRALMEAVQRRQRSPGLGAGSRRM